MNDKEQNIPIIFSDFFQIRYSLYNLMITFGNVDEDKVYYLGKIKMSPQMAKEFYKALERVIKEYEEKYGVINENLIIEQEDGEKDKMVN